TPAWLVVLRSPSTALAATVVAWLLLLDYPYREGLSVQWVQQDALIVAIWVAVALAWFTPVAFGSGTGLITRRLAAPAMVRLSFLTYGIYLWHDLVLRQVTEHLGTDVHLLAAMYLTLLGSVVLAATTFVLLERPLLGARERLRTRRAAPSRPPSARPSGPLAPVGPALDPTPERTPAVAPAAATPARTAAAPRERTAPARRGGSSGGAPGQGWIASIDGLRVLAAVCVITFHVGAEEEIPAAWSQALAAICIPIFATFFVVSGFVLYRPWTMAQARLAYGDGRPPTRAPDGGAVAFWFRRAVRVYPVYWVVQGTALAISGTGDLRTVTDWLQVITLFPLPNLDVIINHGLGVIVWTMIVELAYYLVLPFLARAVTGAIRGGQGFVAANGAVLGALFATFAWFGSTSTRLLGVAACIVIGMAIAALDAWQRANRRWAPGVRGLARQPARSLPVVAVAWGVGALAARGDDPNLLFRTHLGIHLAAMVAVSIVLFVPAVLGPTDGRYRRTLGSRPMRLLGPLTYGIYLWHYPVIRQTVERVDLPLPALQAWVLVVAPLMALLTYRAIEQPLDRLRHRRFGRTTPLAPADREATAR
ncbi:MAG TPA: acyltransferase family protein, partial [Aquihabitans sp.]|nr:acyltransferase family protein [Aquihabitans sp.]